MTKKEIKLLLIDIRAGQEQFYSYILNNAEHMCSTIEVAQTHSIDSAKNQILNSIYDVCLIHTDGMINKNYDNIEKISKISDLIPVLIITPLEDLEFAEYSLNYGVQDYLIEGRFNGTVLAKCIKHVIEKYDLKQQISRLKESKVQMFRNEVTDLPNRNYFIEQVRQAIQQAKRTNNVLSVLFIDLDRFQDINNTLGHDIGNELLKIISQRMQLLVRETDLCAHFSSDNFAIMLNNLQESEDAANIASVLLKAISNPCHLRNCDYYITASIGIAIFPNDAKDHEQILKCSELAMRQAKIIGNEFQYFDKVMTSKAISRVEMVDELRSAIRNQEFSVYLQPQVESKNLNVIGAEALIRWNNPKHGLIYPGDFIEIAENYGLINKIGEWVFDFVCQNMYQIKSKSGKELMISINISPKQLLDTNFVDNLEIKIKKYEINPENICFEFTESVFIENTHRTVDAILKIKTLGFKIALDDFGIKYSCFKYLLDIPIDAIKIDRAFISGITAHSSYLTVVKSILMLSEFQNINIFAEGVETKEQEKILRNEGCEFLQGYLYGHPIPWNQFIETYLEQSNAQSAQ